MIKNFSTLIFVSLFICPVITLAQGQLPDSVTNKLKKAVEGFKNRYNSPSVAVCIIRGNEIVYDEALGYTDVENKVPATIDSKYPIMSITKTFTAIMLMQLVEQGVVELNDDVRKYVPEYKVRSDFPGTGATTLLQLATHTSGLPRNSPADSGFTYSLDKWMLSGGSNTIKPFSTNKQLLNSLQFLKLEFPPYHFVHHNDRHYSNLGYSLLGIAMERAAKTGYPKYVAAQIFKPLGMQFTGFLTEPGLMNQVAKGYRYNKTNSRFEHIPLFEINSGIYAGGTYSTAKDMTKFISAQFESNKLLSADSRAMMRNLKIGWKPAYPYVLHEGAFPAHRSIIVFNPESKIGWVILTNGSDIDFNQINGQLAEILTETYRKPLVPTLEKYAGTYRLPGGYGSLEIYLKNDTLYSNYCQELMPGRPMISDGGLRFKVGGKDGYTINYEFIADQNSAVNALRMGQFVWYKE